MRAVQFAKCRSQLRPARDSGPWSGLLIPAKAGFYSMLSRLALPPAAVVLIVTVRSVAKRSK